MFVILTDGQENSSKEFARNPTAVAAKIRHQETKYSWNFVYIGANQDAFEVGGGIGIRSSMISNYVASSAGTSKAFSDVSEGHASLPQGGRPSGQRLLRPQQVMSKKSDRKKRKRRERKQCKSCGGNRVGVSVQASSARSVEGTGKAQEAA